MVIKMIVTVDISLYPLQEDFKSKIKDFIKNIDNKKFDVIVNNVSTQIAGEYDDIFGILQENIKPVFEKYKAVFVIKILSGNKVKS